MAVFLGALAVQNCSTDFKYAWFIKMIEVLQPGLFTTIQDGGRHGYEAYGVPRSGAIDPFLAAIANKLVGNSADQSLLEFAVTGPDLLFHQDCTVALCGSGAEYDIDGTRMNNLCALRLTRGSALRFRNLKGWFGYLAISGGIVSKKVLASMSTYVSGQIGKRIQKNEMLETGPLNQERFSLLPGYWKFPEDHILQILPAQHTSRFSEGEQKRLTQQMYRIHFQSNRMGIRLEGLILQPPLIRRSTPALSGSVQIPQSGCPIILGPEGPTTGGYAQIGVLSRTSWTVLAATRPGESVRFEWTDAETANRRWEIREQLLHTKSAWQPV